MHFTSTNHARIIIAVKWWGGMLTGGYVTLVSSATNMAEVYNTITTVIHVQ